MLEERRGHDARRWEPFLPISASDAVRDSVVYAAWDPTDDPVDELVDLIADARASTWTVNQDENYAEPGLIQRAFRDQLSPRFDPMLQRRTDRRCHLQGPAHATFPDGTHRV